LYQAVRAGDGNTLDYSMFLKNFFNMMKSAGWGGINAAAQFSGKTWFLGQTFGPHLDHLTVGGGRIGKC
jgi:hypothetical protein